MEYFTSPGAGTLQFPKDIGTGEEFKNHMSFEAMKVSGGVDTRTLKFALAEGRPNAVCLPIPQGLSTAYQNNWDQSEVGGGTAAMARR